MPRLAAEHVRQRRRRKQRAPLSCPAIYGRLARKPQDSFNAAGVEIMSPSYFALRDGNPTTIPADHRPREAPPAFRVPVNPHD